MVAEANAKSLDLTINIDNSLFKNNYASNAGGAIYVHSAVYRLNNVQCINNVARSLGGCIIKQLHLLMGILYLLIIKYVLYMLLIYFINEL